jgi:hypothetical protein
MFIVLLDAMTLMFYFIFLCKFICLAWTPVYKPKLFLILLTRHISVANHFHETYQFDFTVVGILCHSFCINIYTLAFFSGSFFKFAFYILLKTSKYLTFKSLYLM